MRYDANTVTVGGSAVQVSGGSTQQKVRSVTWIAESANTGIVRLGRSGVTTTAGFPLTAGASHIVEFDGPEGPGTENWDDLYIHGTVGGDQVSWSAVFNG